MQVLRVELKEQLRKIRNKDDSANINYIELFKRRVGFIIKKY